MNHLFKKYDKRTPRYTSYPAMPFWNNQLDVERWSKYLETGVSKSGLVDIYIHIPYCNKLCWYCGCNRIITNNQSKADSYIEALKSEFKLYHSKLPSLKINSIHFGGGTPNFLDVSQMSSLLSTFKPYLDDNFQGAIEIDPRVCKEEQLELLASFGFKRISLGVQDFDEKVQKAINRIQSVELVKKVCDWARSFGFNHFNFDLIWGLPLQTPETIKETVRLCNLIGPDQISFYSYAHLPDRFKHQRLINDEDIRIGKSKRELYDAGKLEFEKSEYIEIGMDHYAKRGSLMAMALKEKKLTRNFMGYTDKKAPTLIGLGASSISANKYGFVQNEKDVNRYLERISKGESVIEKSHEKQNEDFIREEIIQDVMCNLKIEHKNLKNLNNFESTNEELCKMVDEGLLSKNNSQYEVTDFGKVFVRNVASLFDQYKGRELKGVKFSKSV